MEANGFLGAGEINRPCRKVGGAELGQRSGQRNQCAKAIWAVSVRSVCCRVNLRPRYVINYSVLALLQAVLFGYSEEGRHGCVEHVRFRNRLGFRASPSGVPPREVPNISPLRMGRSRYRSPLRWPFVAQMSPFCREERRFDTGVDRGARTLDLGITPVIPTPLVRSLGNALSL